MLDRAAMLLSAADAAPEAMAPQFVDLSELLSRGVTPLVAPAAPPAAAAPARTPTPTPGGSAATSGAELRNLLAQGLSGLSPLSTNTFAEPLVGEEDDVIPIEDLLFRGKDALQRALKLGEQLTRSGSVPDSATLAELYDLLQLAAAE